MEKILELGESGENTYPEHFKIFLDNCVKTYADCFGPNDYLFAAVYFLTLETGFSPVGVPYDSTDFDLRTLSSVTGYRDNEVKVLDSSRSKKFCIYQIPLKLGKHRFSSCELQGVPSGEIRTHLIINLLLKEPHIVRSLCLDTNAYVKANDSLSEHKYSLQNLQALSIRVKNKLTVQIKNLILINEEEGCSANLLCIPEEVQKKIIYFLSDDPYGIQALASTCSYFYSIIKNDTKLWEEVCFHEFSGWELNKALQDSSVRGDPNVFRTAFFYLKTNDYWVALLPASQKLPPKAKVQFFVIQPPDKYWATGNTSSHSAAGPPRSIIMSETSNMADKIIRYIIQTQKGPKPVGPYNQAVKVNNVVYLSGVIGMDPKTNQIVPGGIEKETKQIFHNMEAILKASGSGFDKVVKTSVFLNDINDFAKVNDIYKQFIVKDYPARSAYQVGKLPVGAKVEIEAIALCGNVETKYVTE